MAARWFVVQGCDKHGGWGRTPHSPASTTEIDCIRWMETNPKPFAMRTLRMPKSFEPDFEFEGMQAHQAGRAKESNPYKAGTKASVYWLHGWQVSYDHIPVGSKITR